MNLNASQTAVVESTAPRLIVQATAGSGKSRTVIARILRLIETGVNPQHIACLSFSNAAANEIKHRLAGRSIGCCSTLHSFLLRAINANYATAGFSRKVTVLNEESAKELIREVLDETKRANMTESEFETACTEYADTGMQKSSDGMAVARLFAVMRERNVVTFDAVLCFGLMLLRKYNHMDTFPTIAKRITRAVNLKHALIDEAQDSTLLDTLIYDELMAPLESILLVGDKSQQVMQFRSGQNVDMNRWLDDPSFTVMQLEQNYRCAPEIVAASNRLIAHNNDRATVMAVANRLEPVGTVDVAEHADAHEEMVAVGRWLHDHSLEHRFNDLAVLCRLTEHVQQFAEYLQMVGIPVAKSERAQMPPDWSATVETLQLLCDVDNNYLAYKYLVRRDGVASAKRTSMRAEAAGVSINATVLKWKPVEEGAFFKRLAQLGISHESLELLKKVIEEREVKDPSDLLLALSQIDREPTTTAGVYVGTIHSSKGLEFAAVCLPCFEQAIIPANREVSAERNLAYVGITRAKYACRLSFARSRWAKFGPQIAGEPSQFLSEMRA